MCYYSDVKMANFKQVIIDVNRDVEVLIQNRKFLVSSKKRATLLLYIEEIFLNSHSFTKLKLDPNTFNYII